MRIFGLFLFVLLSALTSKAWAQSQTPLVYIYCDYLTSTNPTLETSDQSWSELVRHFEKRELIHQKRTFSENPKFQECVQKNSQLFETGEFIFEGRSQLQSSLGVLQEKNPQPSLVSLESLSFSHEWFSVTVSTHEESVNQASSQQEMIEREKRYSAMWQDFLLTLKQSKETSF